MTDLKILQEACKLIDNYSDVIEIIINEPQSNQREIYLRIGDKYTYIWIRKIVKQLSDVGLVSVTNTKRQSSTSEKLHHINEDALQMVKNFALQYSRLTQK